jgi:hypothetical protein
MNRHDDDSDSCDGSGHKLKPNPCGCRWCNVCGMYGLAPIAKPLPRPDAMSVEAKKTKPATLFDLL